MTKAMKAIKAKRVARQPLRASKTVKKNAEAKKIRVGILVGKDFDPVKKGTQWPEYPANMILTNHDWGKYSIDAATAVRMQQLHPDLLELDLIYGKEVTQKR